MKKLKEKLKELGYEKASEEENSTYTKYFKNKYGCFDIVICYYKNNKRAYGDVICDNLKTSFYNTKMRNCEYELKNDLDVLIEYENNDNVDTRLEKLKKLKNFLIEKFPNGIQMFNNPSSIDDNLSIIYDEDGIEVLYNFDYIEIFGLTEEEFIDVEFMDFKRKE